MANLTQLQMLWQGAEVWNAWRRSKVPAEIDLRDANLRAINLAIPYWSKHVNTEATIVIGEIVGADMTFADLTGADLTEAHVQNVDFHGSSLTNARLTNAMIRNANFRNATVDGLNLSDATISNCVFGELDLRKTLGLESVRHKGPSTIGIDTILRSEGKIPEVFLRGCGVPEEFIVQIPSLAGSIRPLQFHSCFISYSQKNEDFARRLHSAMNSAGLRVWFAPEEMKGGRKLHEQIFSAIQVHDKLLLILSEESMASEWVATEIRRARKVERDQNRRKLFPIRLVDFKKIQQWECFDADNGKDLAVELREYFMPDFSNWKDHDAFEAAFARLLKDLKAEAERG